MLPETPSVEEVFGETEAEVSEQAVLAFKTVFEHGPKIELDHQIVYQARAFSDYVYPSSYPSGNLFRLRIREALRSTREARRS